MTDEKVKNEFVYLLEDMPAEYMRKSILAFEKMMGRYEFCAKETALSTQTGTNNVLVETYLKLELAKGRPKNSVYNSGRYLINLFNTIGKSPGEITAIDVINYLVSYQNQRNTSNRSLNHMRSVMSSFFSWAEKTGYIQKNPVDLTPKFKEPKRQRCYINEKELEELRFQCESEFEKALIELMISTACRIDEISGIQLKDINWESDTISIVGKNNKQRTVKMTPKCRLSIDAYLCSRGFKCEKLGKEGKEKRDSPEYLFVTSRAPHHKLTPHSLRTDFEQVVGRTTFKDLKQVTPHTMRHTWATLALKKGMTIEKVSKYLGHENIATTMIYIGLDQQEINNDVLKYAV